MFSFGALYNLLKAALQPHLLLRTFALNITVIQNYNYVLLKNA